MRFRADKSDTVSVSRPSSPLRYGVAIGSVALALALKLLIDPLIVQDTPFLLVFGAIMVSAWYGGLGPGLFATALAALITDYFFLYPKNSFSNPSLEAAPLVAFMLEGVLVSSLATALRSAKARAEDSEERFRLLVEGVKDYAIFMLDPDGYVASWNEGAKRINGYETEEIIGEHFSRFYTEEDRESRRPEEQLRIAATESHFEEEGLRVRKDDSRFWASVLVTALRDETGTLRGFAQVVRDITERKRVEEDLRRSLSALVALFEAGHILAGSLDRDEIASRLLQVMGRISGLEAAVIALCDGQGRLGQWRSVGPEEVLACIRDRPEVQSASREILEDNRFRSLELGLPNADEERRLTGLLLPLLVRERAIGVLEAYGPQGLAGKEVKETLTSLANQAASALENARLYEELAERERQLRDLVRRVLVAQEEERRRVAYEVHDGLTQIAAAAYRRLDIFAKHRSPDSAKEREDLEDIVELVRRTVSEARRIIADLRPTTLDDFGLATAVRLQLEELHAEGYQVSYQETLGQERLPPTVESALFRVVQEALTNIRKHARTERVRVELGRCPDGAVRLEVRDWGRGFEPTEMVKGSGPGERVGLSSMKERVALLGGDLEIESEPGKGTSVVAEVPLPSAGEEAGHER
jgi:PAS domain S-box-containing protein